MGQGNSKETKPLESENDKPHQAVRAAAAASPAVEATPSSFRDGATPSLSHKLVNYFSPKSKELTPRVAPDHVKYSSASPLPPSSSLLAKSYREELSGISPAQQNQISSSFFLGKVLVSPRRPLREGVQLSQDLGSSASKHASKELGTPKPLKRKASPENASYSKKMKPDFTALPSQKPDWRLLAMRAQVEEQDEVEERETVMPVNSGASDEHHKASSARTGSGENDAHNDVPDVDVEDQHMPEPECEGDRAPLLQDKIAIKDFFWPPSDSPHPLPINLTPPTSSSLSSATCESSAPAYVSHNSTIEELDEDLPDVDDVDADQDEQTEGNVTLTQTIGKVLDRLLKGTLLGTDSKSSVSEESNNKHKNNEENLVFDACEVNDDRSESVPDSPPTTANSEILENGSTELEDEAERSCSEAKSHCSNDEFEMGINNHPRAGTTHSSTVSKKMLTSEYKVTESQVPQKQKCEEKDSLDKQDGCDTSAKDRSDKQDGCDTSTKSVLRSPSSEDSFYHHPPSNSTFSSSISKGKWPSFSMISTSSVSALPVASFQFFKSIITAESLPVESSKSDAEPSPAAPASDVPPSTVDNLAESFHSTKDSSPAASQDKPLELPATDDSTNASLIPTEADDSKNGSVDCDEESVLALLMDDSNGEVPEAIENSEVNKCQKQMELTPENNEIMVNSAVLASTPTVTKPVSSELVTPKRSRRIASKRSSQKAVANSSPMESNAGTSSNRGRHRRRQSSSSESLNTSQESLAEVDDCAPLRSAAKKQRFDKASAAYESTSISENDHVQKVGGVRKKSSASKPESISTKSKFEDLALLRDDASAQHARDNQLMVVVVRSNSNSSSCALIRDLRLQFPLGSFISAAAKHGKKSRRTASQCAGLKQLEWSVMQQVSPIIVEAGGNAVVAPHLLVAHAANYTSVVLHEAAFSSMRPYQPARASLPFCYSWFLSLTDSVELSSVAQQLLRRLLAVPAIKRDLLHRTKHRSAQEFVQSYIRNNTVGGPEILHCTAKGGTSASDVAYTARRDVLRAQGQVSTLQVVGFVITPRTFGARVKLDADQLTLWNNSDSPAVPQAIASMFEEQKAQVPAIDDQASPGASDLEDDAADDPNDILGFKANKKSLKFISNQTSESERFCPTSGLGSRAHITLGCHTQKVHPRTTGFDLLLALQMEKTFNEKYSNGIKEDRTSVHILDIDVAKENKENLSQSREAESQDMAASSEAAENGVAESEAELCGADAGEITMSDIDEAMNVSIESNGPEMTSSSLQFSNVEAVPDTDCVTFSIDGALVRGYGEGVWVVYPEQHISVSAVFAGFHNAQ